MLTCRGKFPIFFSQNPRGTKSLNDETLVWGSFAKTASKLLLAHLRLGLY